MLDIQLLRQDINSIAEKLQTRGFNLDTETFTRLEQQRKQLQIRTEELQSKRNNLSKQIGALKGQGKHDEANQTMAEVAQIKTELEKVDQDYQTIQNQINNLILTIPNLPHSDVPVGKDENDNIEIRRFGTPRQFNFEIKDHVDLGEPLGLDFKTGSELSGARFSLMRGPIARLHRALAQFMLDTHTQQHGYTEHYTPYIVNPEILLGTGQLPKFAEDMYKVSCGGEENTQEQYLISTAEITLTNTVRESIL
ncbi:Seryl-tRNA synthetase, partial [Snodgrassella alvi SCGC AB-598-O11]